MNGEEFQTIEADLARDQIMDAGTRTQALVHGANCDKCGMRSEDEHTLTAGLRSLADQMKSLEAGPQVEAQVLAAFRDRVDARRVSALSSRWFYWVGAAAAAVLAVFGVLAMRGHVAAPAVQPAHENVKAETTVKPPTPTDQSLSILGRKDAPAAALHDRKPRRATTGHAKDRQASSVPSTAIPTGAESNSEIATDFFPVGDGSALNLEEGGQLVRVELPRSALVRFGLPVNLERANERVKADVLFGADGLARAIRFVQ